MMNLPNNIISARWIHGLPHDRFIRDEIIHDEIIVGWNFHRINLLPIKSSHEEIVHNKLAQNKDVAVYIEFPHYKFAHDQDIHIETCQMENGQKIFYRRSIFEEVFIILWVSWAKYRWGGRKRKFFFSTDSLMDSPT